MAGTCEYDDEPSGSKAAEPVSFSRRTLPLGVKGSMYFMFSNHFCRVLKHGLKNLGLRKNTDIVIRTSICISALLRSS